MLFTSTAVLSCAPRARSGAACAVDYRMLLDLVPAGTGHVTGMQRARYIVSKGVKRSWSKSLEAAHELVGALGLRGGLLARVRR